MGDRRILYTAAFLRALATGMVGVLFGVYLAKLRFDSTQIGFVVGAGLAGAAVAALVVTLSADRLGYRKTLVVLGLLGGLGGAALAFSSQPVAVAAAAFLGMVNGMGRDRGASMILEQAVLPLTATPEGRTQAFAYYNILQDIGHSLGALLAALPELLSRTGLWPEVVSFRLSLGLYALLLLLSVLPYLGLSPEMETVRENRMAPLSPASRRILWKISSFFALDSLGGGFLTAALLSFFFYKRFGVNEGEIGLLFFGARLANALSHLGAAWLAKRIGLVNTMVFTHIPSSLLLVTVPFAPNFLVAALLFLLREGLVEMDVPTRQSYVMAVVRPGERTRASGVTNLVRLGAWAVAPSLAGLFMQGASLAAPLFVGAGLKVGYDILLYWSFRHLRPSEEI